MVLARFLPRNERFFDYFQQAAENAAEVARALCDLLEHYSDIEQKAHRVRNLERRGDAITHQIFKALYSAFVTPLDREDIADLASRLGIPVSTTHVISSAILGVGVTRRLSAVRWGVAGRIVVAWIVTIPACIAFGWAIYSLLHLATGAR